MRQIHGDPPRDRAVLRAGVISLIAGTAIMGAKFSAWYLTGSSALLADAAESVVNVAAAALMTLSVVVAARPADADHPYGHGKAEFLSAAVEGTLILLAAAVIVVEGIRKLVVGVELEQVGTGMVIAGAAGIGNLLLGLYLVRVGRQARSSALEADGHHVLSDVWTTAGTVLALLAIRVTGFSILDPLVALLVGAHILRTGWKVMRQALGGLLDEADFELLEEMARHLESIRRPEWVEIHQLRAWSSGATGHVDLHLVLPRYFSVENAHKLADELEARVLEGLPGPGDVVVHIDPCLPSHCQSCAMKECPVRSKPLEEPLPLTVETLTRRGTV